MKQITVPDEVIDDGVFDRITIEISDEEQDNEELHAIQSEDAQ